MEGMSVLNDLQKINASYNSAFLLKYLEILPTLSFKKFSTANTFYSWEVLFLTM